MPRWIVVMCCLLLLACSRPEFDVLDGQDRRLQELGGKVVFINYFAEWCPPCREEIPALNAFHATHGSQAAVFGVNFDPLPEDDLRDVRAKLDIRFPVLLEPPYAVLKGRHPEVMPTTFVLDGNGQVVTELIGPQTEQSLLATMREVAGQ